MSWRSIDLRRRSRSEIKAYWDGFAAAMGQAVSICEKNGANVAAQQIEHFDHVQSALFDALPEEPAKGGNLEEGE